MPGALKAPGIKLNFHTGEDARTEPQAYGWLAPDREPPKRGNQRRPGRVPERSRKPSERVGPRFRPGRRPIGAGSGAREESQWTMRAPELLRALGRRRPDRCLLMHHVAGVGPPKTMKFLMENGEDPEIRDTEGRTGLHRAAAYNGADMVDFPFRSGANMRARDDRGETPLHKPRRGRTAPPSWRRLRQAPTKRRRPTTGKPLTTTRFSTGDSTTRNPAPHPRLRATGSVPPARRTLFPGDRENFISRTQPAKVAKRPGRNNAAPATQKTGEFTGRQLPCPKRSTSRLKRTPTGQLRPAARSLAPKPDPNPSIPSGS